jgi:hypothetical protein
MRAFLRWLDFGSRTTSEPTKRRYNGGGGMRAADELPPTGPNNPGGIPALPMSGDRPCINVTPKQSEQSRRK